MARYDPQQRERRLRREAVRAPGGRSEAQGAAAAGEGATAAAEATATAGGGSEAAEAAPEAPHCLVCTSPMAEVGGSVFSGVVGCCSPQLSTTGLAASCLQTWHLRSCCTLCNVFAAAAVSENCTLTHLLAPAPQVAIGACNHKEVCGQCTLRLRLCYGRHDCPL